VALPSLAVFALSPFEKLKLHKMFWPLYVWRGHAEPVVDLETVGIETLDLCFQISNAIMKFTDKKNQKLKFTFHLH